MSADAEGIEVRRSPVVVVGSGVAGLSAALAHGSATVLTGGALGATGSSPWAQGGIAAAIAPDDDPADHLADSLTAGAGLNVVEAARTIVEGGPAAIDRLVRSGARFDRRPDGSLALGREAAHSHRRIVHADGDATGAEVMRVLTAATRSTVVVRERTTAVDLLTADGRVAGVLAVGPDGRLVAELAGAVVLATGGYAHCFARTTAPSEVDGAGIAAAVRAGAVVADMEFVQFHPTALAVDGPDRLPLLTEALRGDGAAIVDELGQRFVGAVHPDGELAPRDVVALAVYRHLAAGHEAYLDTRGAIGDALPDRFPTVFASCRAHGIDPRSEAIPITPAAHYCMGGVATDHQGRSTLDGLWVVGEAASSGAHGANRLASNSLLDGLVVGHGVASLIGRTPAPEPSAVDVAAGFDLPTGRRGSPRTSELRRLLWQAAGVERDGVNLADAGARLDRWPTPLDLTERTALTIARLVVGAAERRTESRGAHRRRDHPAQLAHAARSSERSPASRLVRLAVAGDRLVPPARVAA